MLDTGQTETRTRTDARSRVTLASVAVLAGVLMLGGCAGGANADTAEPSAAPDTPVTPTPAASPKPTPKPTSTPAAALAPSPTASLVAEEEPPTASPAADPTCETALAAPAIADIEAAGYTLHTELPSGPDPVMATLVDHDGLSCYWARNGGDVVAWYGQADMDAEAWSAQLAELTAEGFRESNDPILGSLEAPLASDTGTPVVFHVDGVTYYVSRAYLLPSVSALQ